MKKYFWLLIALTGVALVVGALTAYLHGSSGAVIHPILEDTQLKDSLLGAKTNQSSPLSSNPFPSALSFLPLTGDKKSETLPKISKEEIAASEKLKTKVFDVAKIHIPLPKDMVFREIDLDEEMLAITGFNYKTNTNLTLIAYRGTATQDQVIKFLRESAPIIPNLTTEIIDKISPVESVGTVAGSGLKDNSLWEAKDDKNLYYFLFANRKDQRGSYLAIFSGPIQGVNIDTPDMMKIADQIKAVPVK